MLEPQDGGVESLSSESVKRGQGAAAEQRRLGLEP
jgi:hypothetical protein